MNRTRSGSGEFPQPQQPDKLVVAPSEDALFDLVPDRPPRTPAMPQAVEQKPPSAAWTDTGSRKPFVLDDDLDRSALDAIHAMSPNRQTERAIHQDDTNRRFGLSGHAELSDDQLANLKAAAEQGSRDRVARRIEAGMSHEEAVAREMVRATRLGKDPQQFAL